MMPGLIVMGSSAVVLALLVILFRSEDARGQRIIFPRVRGFLDRVVQRFEYGYRSMLARVGGGTFRAILHYFLHGLLTLGITVLDRLQRSLAHLQLRNKHIARRVRNRNEVDTHLHRLHEHKREHALTETQKRQLKRG